MNKLNWLMSSSPDGATYLQVIIELVILFFVLCGLKYMVKDIFKMFKECDFDDDRTSEN